MFEKKDNDIYDDENKTNKVNKISRISKVLKLDWKSITIDKWLLMGAAGIVLILCSDWFGGSSEDDNTGDKGDNRGEGYGLQADAYDSNQYAYDTYIGNISDYKDNLEEELKGILQSVEGAGEVKVMITLKNSSTREVLMEEPYTESNTTEEDGDGGSREVSDISRDYRVIYEENGDGQSVPYVVSESYPEVEGVVVIAEGGDSATIKEKITSIIKALFDIEINKIAVGKMK